MRLIIIFLYGFFTTGILCGQQIMPAERLAAVRASLPDFESDEIQELIHDERIVWYDNQTMPPAYQHRNPNGAVTLHSPTYNISADPSDSGLPHGSGGNGNITSEVAWALKPGGTHRARGVNSYKGILLPDGKPVVIYRSPVRGRIGTSYTDYIVRWAFPRGTTFVEVITQRIRDHDHPFEIRTRTLAFPDGKGPQWDTQVFAPVRNAEDLADKLEQLASPDTTRVAAIQTLRGPDQTYRRMRLRTGHHNREVAFDETQHMSDLPPIPTRDILDIYAGKWVDVTGDNWRGEAMAPSNMTGAVNLVPPGYLGAFVKADCDSCHAHVARHVTEFQANRGWYGRIRGGGSSGAASGILTWHPFAPSSIAYNGSTVPVQYRKAFTDAGTVVSYDKSIHGVEDYRVTGGGL